MYQLDRPKEERVQFFHGVFIFLQVWRNDDELGLVIRNCRPDGPKRCIHFHRLRFLTTAITILDKCNRGVSPLRALLHDINELMHLWRVANKEHPCLERM